MPRHNYIRHPDGAYHLRIYRHLVDLFGGDVGCAAIVDRFDYAALQKYEEHEFAGDTEGLLWITCTLTSLHRDLCGLYSTRRIRERLAFLVAHQILIPPSDQDVYARDESKKLTFLLNKTVLDLWLLPGNEGKLPFEILSAEETKELAGGQMSPGTNVTQRGTNVTRNLIVRTSLEPSLEGDDGEKPKIQHPNLDVEPESPPQQTAPVNRKPFSRFAKKERKLGLTAQVSQGMARNEAETALESISTSSPVVRSAPGYNPMDGWLWFSSAYPQHRVNKTEDLKYWKMAVLDEKTEDLIRERLPSFIRSRQWAKDGGEYIPSARRFLEKRIFTMTPGPPGEVVEKTETREEFAKRMGLEYV